MFAALLQSLFQLFQFSNFSAFLRHLLGIALCLVLVAGCATESGKNVTAGRTQQDTSPVVANRQLESTKGPTINVYNYVFNAPARGPGVPVPGIAGFPASQPSEAVAELASANVGPISTGRAGATYQQSGLYLSTPITIGDNTGTATQNPTSTNTSGSQTSTQNPSTQGETSPRTQVNPALGFGMPGSAVTASSSGTAAFDGATATGAPQTTSPNQQPVTLTGLQPSQIQSALQTLAQWLSGKAPTSQPTTQP